MTRPQNGLTGPLTGSVPVSPGGQASTPANGPRGAQPQAARPQAARPQAAQPQAARPQAAQPQLTQAQGAQPQAAQPQLTQAQGAQVRPSPQAVQPHGSHPAGPRREGRAEDASFRPPGQEATAVGIARHRAAADDGASVYGPAGGDDDQVWAIMAYLGMIFFAFVPPLVVYLYKRNESQFVRFHAAQALNLWITTFCYSISFMIIGGLLSFDTVWAALSVAVPLLTATGLALLSYAIIAATAAGRGAQRKIPSWICGEMVK